MTFWQNYSHWCWVNNKIEIYWIICCQNKLRVQIPTQILIFLISSKTTFNQRQKYHVRMIFEQQNQSPYEKLNTKCPFTFRWTLSWQQRRRQTANTCARWPIYHLFSWLITHQPYFDDSQPKYSRVCAEISKKSYNWINTWKTYCRWP